MQVSDRLCLVTYDTDVYVDFPLLNMNEANKKRAETIISQLWAGTSTNLSGGLMKGLDQISMRDDEGKNEVASVLLFTDGHANYGI